MPPSLSYPPWMQPKATRPSAPCHPTLGEYALYCEGDPQLLFTDNATNRQRLFNQPNPTPYVKDAFHEYVVGARHEAVNPAQKGTKSAAYYRLVILPARLKKFTCGCAPPRLRISSPSEKPYQSLFAARLAEADAFYDAITPAPLNADRRMVMRQALAGMLWSKQYLLL